MKKKPWVGALLSIPFSELGYFYWGWRAFIGVMLAAPLGTLISAIIYRFPEHLWNYGLYVNWGIAIFLHWIIWAFHTEMSDIIVAELEQRGSGIAPNEFFDLQKRVGRLLRSHTAFITFFAHLTASVCLFSVIEDIIFVVHNFGTGHWVRGLIGILLIGFIAGIARYIGGFLTLICQRAFEGKVVRMVESMQPNNESLSA